MNEINVKLNDVIDSANRVRKERGIRTVSMNNFIRTTDFKEIVLASEERSVPTNTGTTKKQKALQVTRDYKSSPLVKIISDTRPAEVWVNRQIGLCVAAHLDKQMAVDLLSIITASPIVPSISLIDDAYKSLADVRQWLIENKESESDISDKIQLLNDIIAARCGVSKRLNSDPWNYATSEQLYARRDLQFAIAAVVGNRLIKSFQQLLEFVANGYFPIENLKSVNLKKILKHRNNKKTVVHLFP